MACLDKIDLHHGALPSHMSVDIWEEYARQILMWLEPSIYSSLVVADKPDLVDVANDLGVEVTWSESRESIKIDALYLRYCNETDVERRKRIMEKLSRLNARVGKFACLHPKGSDDFSLILNSHRKKLRLLNQGGYRFLSHNHLFVMSDVVADKTMLEAALSEFEQAASCYAISFEQVLVAVPGYIYTFALREHDYCVTEISSNEQYKLAMTARRNVLDIERELRD